MNRSRSYPALVAILLAMGLTKLSASPVSFSHAIDTGATAGESSIAGGSSTTLDKDARRRIEGVYGKLPLSFEMNQGQFDAKVRFISRGDGYNLLLTSTEVVFHLSAGAPASSKRRPGIRRPTSTVLKMKMLGANRSPQVEGQVRMRGTSNYFIGAESSRWRTGVPSYERVLYREIYPGIDMVYYGNRRELEYDFHIAPGASPDVIEMGFTGARRVRINKEGGLDIGTVAGDVRIKKPFIYQENAGSRQEIKGGYVLLRENRVGFKVAPYDTSRPLVIDPILTYSTYLGGSSFDGGRAIAVDSAGNAYVTGLTQSFNFPITIDAFDTTYANNSDVFVTKIDPTGTALVYSTYIGSQGEDQGLALAIDADGNAYVTGATNSINFPTTPGAYQTQLGGFFRDAFVTKINSTGTDLIYSTFLGGSESEQGNSIAVDDSGNAFITGPTSSSDFPTTPGAYQTELGGSPFSGSDAFITKLNNTGTNLVYSTFLGGNRDDQGNSIKADLSGNAYVTGSTISMDFDVTEGAFQTVFGGATGLGLGDAFVTKINDTGTGLIYSTYIGGTFEEAGFGIDLSTSGEAYITGVADSPTFPTTPGALKVIKEGVARTNAGGDIWVAVNTGFQSFDINALAIDPNNSSTIYAGTREGGIYKSTNGGQNWSAMNSGLTDLEILTIAVDPTNQSLIYLGTSNRGVFRSTDSGATWRAINTGLGGPTVSVLKIDPANPSTLYAATGSGLFKSTNGGANWSAVSISQFHIGVDAMAIDPTNTAIIFAGLRVGGVFKSTNSGASWQQTTLSSGFIHNLAIDPINSAIVYAVTQGGIFKTTDGGAIWLGANTGIENRVTLALAIDPTNPLILFAGTEGGAYKSTDGGNIWSALDSGLAGVLIKAMVIDANDPNTVYSGALQNQDISDGFVTRLSSDGANAIYSTFIGGNDEDHCSAIVLDSSGNAILTGSTRSTNFPTTQGGFRTLGSIFGLDSFVAKLNPSGAGLAYSTYLGGNQTDQSFGLDIDSSVNIYIAGLTESFDFPITPGAFQTILGGSQGSFNSDAFITKIPPAPSFSSDLNISMIANQSSAVAGNSVAFSITLTNNGPDPAFGLQVVSDLPSLLGSAGCFGSTGNCTASGNGVVFNINTLAVGQVANLTIIASVSCPIPASITIENMARASSSGFDPNTSDNSAMANLMAINPETMLNPSGSLFSATGGNGSVFVNRGASCPWTATSNASWLTVTSSSNFGNGFVDYSVAANTGPPRIGMMTIAGVTFTVNQQGTCTFAISPGNESFAGNGGSGTVDVTAPPGCMWIAVTNNPEFITITSGGGGSGDGTVTYSVAANPGPAIRNGAISIAGQTFDVFQGINFSDVPPEHPFYTEIGKLSARGVTLGCDAGLYCPSDIVLRDQMAAFIIRAVGDFNPPPPVMQRFIDVPPSHPFYAFIEQMAIRQITLGCTPNMYCPSDPVLREQMAAFIIRALGEFDPPEPAMQRFLDVPPSNPFYRFIDRMAVLQITLGCGGGNYCPSDPVTRGQMAAFLVRAFDL